MRAMLVTCGIVGAGLSLVAQSPPGRSVTLTGCLERTFGGYSLTIVQRGAGQSPPDRPAAGVVVAQSRATGSMPTGPMDDSVVARSDGSVDLNDHINRRVKVTGTMQELASPGSDEGAAPPAIGIAVVTVTSVQTVSRSCP